MKQFYLTLALIPLLSLSLLGQTVGGDAIAVHTVTRDFWIGNHVAGLGDVNGDGTPDFLTCSDSWDRQGSVTRVYSGLDGSILFRWVFPSLRMSASEIGDVDMDGHTDVLLATVEDLNGNPGVVRVYSGATGAELRRWEMTMDSNFIWVENAGDIDGDGANDVVVGLSSADVAGVTRAGVVLVFSGATGAQLLQINGWIQNQNFGFHVGGAGDVDADGLDDIQIYAVMNPSNSGAAYVYSGATGTLIHEWTGGTSDGLGFAMEAPGDTNQDGFDDVLVGAPYKGGGVVFLYSGATGGLLGRWDATRGGENFGISISMAGDQNQDGTDDFIVGADDSSTRELFAGAAFVYSGSDGRTLQIYEGTHQFGKFGRSVGVLGDVNGNGTPEILIGGPTVPPDGTTYVYDPILRDPYISANRDSISASMGGQFIMNLDFPPPFADESYQIYLSGSGTDPFFVGSGAVNPGLYIPLVQDQLYLDSAQQIYPAPTTGMTGVLDGLGQATASFSVPGGLPAALIGRELFFAAVGNEGLDQNRSSAAVSFEVVP